MPGKVKSLVKLLFKAEFPLGLKKIDDLIPGHFLGVRSHTAKKSVGTLIGFVFSFRDMNDSDIFDKLNGYRNGGLAVVGNILILGADLVVGLYTDNRAVVGDTDEYSSSRRICKGGDFPGKRGVNPFLEFDQLAFALLDDIIQFLAGHGRFYPRFLSFFRFHRLYPFAWRQPIQVQCAVRLLSGSSTYLNRTLFACHTFFHLHNDPVLPFLSSPLTKTRRAPAYRRSGAPKRNPDPRGSARRRPAALSCRGSGRAHG